LTELIIDFQEAVKADPLRFVNDWLGVSLWEKQAEILSTLFNINRLAVRSGNGVGKSYLAASAAITWLVGNGGYVLITSSSWTNVKLTAFPTIRKILSSMPDFKAIGGDIHDVSWKLGDQHGAWGLSPDKPENFSGMRSDRPVFVIVDEASSLHPQIFEAIEGLCSGQGSTIWMLGNPLKPTGPFRDVFRDPSWKTFHISTEESPNVKAGKEVVPGLASREWVEGRANKWGKDSPTYRSRICGDFPDNDNDLFIPTAWMEKVVQGEQLEWPKLPSQVKVGVDVARFGGDRTIILARTDKGLIDIQSFRGADLMSTTGQVVKLIKAGKVLPENIFVDDAGLGGGVTDRLHEQGYQVKAVNFASRANESDRFTNSRAESHWALRDLFEDGFKLPTSRTGLWDELTELHVQYDSKGRIKAEPKADLKERIGRSPDEGDALALTCYRGEEATGGATW
jgi:hypothetical protein